MVMRTYYLPPEPEPREEPPPPRRAGAYDDTTPVRHGYTVADLSRIAGVCIRAAARRGVRDLDDKRAAAMCALIQHLHEVDCDPGSSALLRTAENAISNASDRYWANQGLNANTHEPQKGFPRFWNAGAAALLDERVTERVAVYQILAALPQRQDETIPALAAAAGRAHPSARGVRRRSEGGCAAARPDPGRDRGQPAQRARGVPRAVA